MNYLCSYNNRIVFVLCIRHHIDNSILKISPYIITGNISTTTNNYLYHLTGLFIVKKISRISTPIIIRLYKSTNTLNI